MKQHRRLRLVKKPCNTNFLNNRKRNMATKKTAIPQPGKPSVEKLTSKFRVVIPGIVDFDSDAYDFFIDDDGEVRLDDTWFAGTDQAVKALRAMADFMESYKEKTLGK